MPKILTENAADAALSYIAARANVLAVCTGLPTTAAAALTGETAGGTMLARLGLGGSDAASFAVAPGANSGRRLIAAAQSDILVQTSGIATHIAVVDDIGDELLLVTELTEAQALSAGAVVSLRSFALEIADPV